MLLRWFYHILHWASPMPSAPVVFVQVLQSIDSSEDNSMESVLIQVSLLEKHTQILNRL